MGRSIGVILWEKAAEDAETRTMYSDASKLLDQRSDGLAEKVALAIDPCQGMPNNFTVEKLDALELAALRSREKVLMPGDPGYDPELFTEALRGVGAVEAAKSSLMGAVKSILEGGQDGSPGSGEARFSDVMERLNTRDSGRFARTRGSSASVGPLSVPGAESIIVGDKIAGYRTKRAVVLCLGIPDAMPQLIHAHCDEVASYLIHSGF